MKGEKKTRTENCYTSKEWERRDIKEVARIATSTECDYDSCKIEGVNDFGHSKQRRAGGRGEEVGGKTPRLEWEAILIGEDLVKQSRQMLGWMDLESELYEENSDSKNKF